MEGTVREKKHRLPRDCYRGEGVMMVTVRTSRTGSGLCDEEAHSAFRRILGEAAAAHHCDIPIYSLMPDHLHFLIRGKQRDSDFYSATIAFRLRFGIWLGNHRKALKLQKGFYDHILRPDEGRHDQAVYIAYNPVRKGFVLQVLDWPYTGAIGYDLQDVLR